MLIRPGELMVPHLSGIVTGRFVCRHGSFGQYHTVDKSLEGIVLKDE